MTEPPIGPLFNSADTVAIGDTIRWCGRTVTVLDAYADTTRRAARRRGVYLIVEATDLPPRKLHYFADEMVEMADAE